MSKLVSLLLALHSYNYALQYHHEKDIDEVESSAKFGTLTAVALIPSVLFVVAIKTLMPNLSSDEFKIAIVTFGLVSVFGMARYTGRLYTQNAVQIRELGESILEHPEQGRNWARNRLATIYFVQFFLIIILATLGRLYVIHGSGQPLISL